ncbi:MAG TPA: hypothetical protein VM056_06260 [Terriglobales bacterium]|nr:hypothetical protein [Terriglobales bacterium]
MTTWQRVQLVFWLVIAVTLPASANNPPQPDGILSLLLIFPLVIASFHFSGTSLTEKQRKWRIAKRLLLGIAVILTLGGTEVAFLPLLALLLYGCIRGIDILRRGQGGKRILFGSLVIGWTLFAVSDYMVSLNSWPRTAIYESNAVNTLRTLARAEEEFVAQQQEKKKVSGPSTPGPFASLAELQESRLIDSDLLTRGSSGAYRYRVELTAAPPGFFISAMPAEYGSVKSDWKTWIPGRSWMASMRPRLVAQRSFTVDETGTIREADLGTSRPVTRQEAEKWQPLN